MLFFGELSAHLSPSFIDYSFFPPQVESTRSFHGAHFKKLFFLVARSQIFSATKKKFN